MADPATRERVDAEVLAAFVEQGVYIAPNTPNAGCDINITNGHNTGTHEQNKSRNTHATTAGGTTEHGRHDSPNQTDRGR